MIPKIIHYCWFGRNPLPESAQKCIASWRKFFPDYEIWQWSEETLNENENQNEKNNLCDKILGFDVNSIQYTREAYEAKKYSFVSDYARFWILYKYGGLYFDTDVEVIKPMGEIIERGPFMGCEKSRYETGRVAPGLGLGAYPGMDTYKEILDIYKIERFNKEHGNEVKTIVDYITDYFSENTRIEKNKVMCLKGIIIYPDDFFCPMDSTTGIIMITNNTVSIHHYDCSWMNHNTLSFKLHLLKNWLYRFMGPKIVSKIRFKR